MVAPPGGTPRSSYQLTTLPPDAPYVDPARWQHETPVREGSWWPAWEAWLADQAGPLAAPPPMPAGLGAAPGEYVLAP